MDQSDPAVITPADSPLTIADVMTSPVYRELFTPMVSVGDPAFDFELPRLGPPGQAVRLSTYFDRRPVALIFGSFT